MRYSLTIQKVKFFYWLALDSRLWAAESAGCVMVFRILSTHIAI